MSKICHCLVFEGWQRQEGVQYEWADVCKPAGRLRVPALLQQAQDWLQEGAGVLVHCMQGKHRTGAFCTCLSAIIYSLMSYRLCVGVGEFRSSDFSTRFQCLNMFTETN